MSRGVKENESVKQKIRSLPQFDRWRAPFVSSQKQKLFYLLDKKCSGGGGDNLFQIERFPVPESFVEYFFWRVYMKRTKQFVVKVMSLLLALCLVAGSAPISAGAAEKPSKYLSSSSMDVNKCFIGLTEAEFNMKLNQDADPAVQMTSNGINMVTDITFSESGCLTFKAYVSDWWDTIIGLYCDKEESKNYIRQSKISTLTASYPVDKESTVFQKCSHPFLSGAGDDTGAVWFIFVPMSQMIKMDYCEENEDGSYTFYVKNVADNIDHITVNAFNGLKTARDADAEKEQCDYYGISTETGAKVKLEKKGTYTLIVTVFTDDDSQMEFVQAVKTSDYAKKSAVKLKKPLAAFAGTKVVVGKADPGATVNCEYNKQKYQVTADDMGLYIIELKDTLAKKKKIKLWQQVGKMKGASKSFTISK